MKKSPLEVATIPTLGIECAANILSVATTVGTILLLITGTAFQKCEKPTRLISWLIIHALSSVFSICCLSYFGLVFLGIDVMKRVEAEFIIWVLAERLAYLTGAFIWGATNYFKTLLLLGECRL